MNDKTGPAQPRLRPGVSTAEISDGLLVMSAARRLVLTSNDTGRLMHCLDLLDGQRDTGALGALLDLPEPTVARLLELLWRSGLTEGEPSPAAQSLPGHVAAYLSGPFAAMAGDPADTCFAELVAGATVHLTGPEAVTALADADLRELGIRVVTGMPPANGRHAPAAPEPGLGAGLAVVTPGDGGCRAALGGARGVVGRPVIRFAAGRDWSEIGPIFQDGYPACASCFQRGYTASGLDVGQPPSPPETGPAAELAAGLLVQHAVALLTGMLPPLSTRCLHRTRLPGVETERYLVTPYADCTDCGLADATAGVQQIADYEAQAERPPWQWPALVPVSPTAGDRNAGPQPASAEGDSANQLRHLAYLPQLALPRAGDTCPGSPAHSEGPGAVAMAGLLARLAAAASGDPVDDRLGDEPAVAGRAAGVELYVLASGELFGLPGSAYRYEDVTHQVTTVSSDTDLLARCMACSDLNRDDLVAVVAFVGNVRKSGHAGGNSSFRLANLRTGFAVAELLAMASEQRLTVDLASRWTAEVAELLELRADREIITALAGLGPTVEGMPCR